METTEVTLNEVIFRLIIVFLLLTLSLTFNHQLVLFTRQLDVILIHSGNIHTHFILILVFMNIHATKSRERSDHISSHFRILLNGCILLIIIIDGTIARHGIGKIVVKGIKERISKYKAHDRNEINNEMKLEDVFWIVLEACSICFQKQENHFYGDVQFRYL